MSHKDTALAAEWIVPADDNCLPTCSDADDARNLCRRLELAGIEPLVQLKRNQAFASEAALPVDAATIFGSEAAVSQLHDQVFALLARGVQLSVSVTGLSFKEEAPELLRCVCEVLRAAARGACTRPDSIELVVDAAALTPHSIWLIRRELLGEGPVYLIADGERMNPAGGWSSRERCEQFWLQLWHLRDANSLRAACASIVSSQCPLLSAEVATHVLPSTGIQAPAGSAWVPMRLDLTRFADARGAINEPALEFALNCCVDIGDGLHDLMEWPTAVMRHDAWLNRRLAIIVTGIGDLAYSRRPDPQQLHRLENLDQLLCWVQQTLHARSRQIARQTTYLPALELSDPGRSLPGGEVRDDWCMRWRRAVDQGAVKHRNLLVVSPWSVFPTNRTADMLYADLLPLVAYGDACAFRRSIAISHWNINEFKSFHQRAWAALQQRDAAALIAERV